MRKVGINRDGNTVYINDDINNLHMYACGKSGTGKSTFMICQIIYGAQSGERALIFNWHNSLTHRLINPKLYKEYKKYVHVIDVANSGIHIPLFDQLVDENGIQEKKSIVVDRVTTLLSKHCGLSPLQTAELYEIVEEIYDNKEYQNEGIYSIMKRLLEKNTSRARTTAMKLRCICSHNIFQDGEFIPEDALIIEYDLNGLEYDTQLIIVNFMIDYIQKLSHKRLFVDKPLNVFIDEAQNLTYGDGSTMYNIINESRKLDLNVLLASPSLYAGRKKGMDVVTQCETTFYFQVLDSDRDRVTETIDKANKLAVDEEMELLQKGQCIACGKFTVETSDGMEEVNQPIQLSVDLI